MHKKALPAENERLSKQAWREAQDTLGLVPGIDDFAIKKGHTYNTGIHNLRGETMLDLLWPQARRPSCLCSSASQLSGAEPQSSCDGLGSGVSHVDQRMLPECHPHCGSISCSRLCHWKCPGGPQVGSADHVSQGQGDFENSPSTACLKRTRFS